MLPPCPAVVVVLGIGAFLRLWPEPWIPYVPRSCQSVFHSSCGFFFVLAALLCSGPFPPSFSHTDAPSPSPTLTPLCSCSALALLAIPSPLFSCPFLSSWRCGNISLSFCERLTPYQGCISRSLASRLSINLLVPSAFPGTAQALRYEYYILRHPPPRTALNHFCSSRGPRAVPRTASWGFPISVPSVNSWRWFCRDCFACCLFFYPVDKGAFSSPREISPGIVVM